MENDKKALQQCDKEVKSQLTSEDKWLKQCLAHIYNDDKISIIDGGQTFVIGRDFAETYVSRKEALRLCAKMPNK